MNPLLSLSDSGAPPKVLLLDRDASSRTHLGEGLIQNGFRVISVADDVSLLRTARGERPSIIILHFKSPDSSGLEVCKILAHEERTHVIPVILMMAGGDEVQRVLAFELGVDDCVPKSVSLRELTLRIKCSLSRAQGRRVEERREKEFITRPGRKMGSQKS